MKIFLIISKHKEIVDTIRSAMPKDASIHTCDEIDNALTIHHKHMADVLFLDAMLQSPKISGNSLVQLFNRFREVNPSLGIVALASKTDVHQAVTMVKAGADDYLTYPIDPAEISLMIESLADSLVQNLEMDYLLWHAG